MSLWSSIAPLMQDSDMNMILRLAGFSRCADSSHSRNLTGGCGSPVKLELHCMRLASRDIYLTMCLHRSEFWTWHYTSTYTLIYTRYIGNILAVHCEHLERGRPKAVTISDPRYVLFCVLCLFSEIKNNSAVVCELHSFQSTRTQSPVQLLR